MCKVPADYSLSGYVALLDHSPSVGRLGRAGGGFEEGQAVSRPMRSSENDLPLPGSHCCYWTICLWSVVFVLVRICHGELMDRLFGARQVLARSLRRTPDAWTPYAQCGCDFDARARELLQMMQVTSAFVPPFPARKEEAE